MASGRIRLVSRQAEIPQAQIQVPLPLVQELWSAHDGFLALCIETGQQVLGAMMEQDRIVLCGPK